MAPGSIPGLRSLGETIAQVTHPLIGDRRAPLAEVRALWSEIVGHRLAPLCRPSRFVAPPRARSGGTLQLQVASGAVALQLQHRAPLLIERINGCLGFPAVARLTMIHAPLPTAAVSEDARALAAGLGDRRAAASVPLDSIRDPRLRASLARLARRLAGTDSPALSTQDPAFPSSDDTQSL